MQQPFSSLFAHLLNTQSATPLLGFWLIHGDEPLTTQWLIDACRPFWQKHQQVIKRIELSSHQSWHEVIFELDSLSLFGDASAIIVTGNHKPKADSNTLSTLERIAKDTPHHLIWCLPKQDKKSLASHAIRLFDQYGLVIDGNIRDERMRRELLQIQAKHFGITLNDHAWELLLSHTQNNLLAAHQNLWRLSLSYPHDTINETKLTTCLIDGATFSIFDLSDAILAGNTTKALQILTHLKTADIAPSIILWNLNKDARLLMQIQTGKQPHQLGIWRNKITLYTNASRRTSLADNQRWQSIIFNIDKTIKGIKDGDVWHLLQQLVLSMCLGHSFMG
ncbi:DNA polymerase III subunit delta [Moraxella oculi]|uniref:DNA polymerase III subunit delta n=1 Tax=Moraxella oculi TaxID=2940516 RepID=A0ABW8U7G4_9GAMM